MLLIPLRTKKVFLRRQRLKKIPMGGHKPRIFGLVGGGGLFDV